RLVGCIAIMEAAESEAQLRWFLVDPAMRGQGLGKRLIHEAVAFSRRSAYQRIILWTVSQLTAAAHIYTSSGFRKVEEKPGRCWGINLVEEKYQFDLG